MGSKHYTIEELDSKSLDELAEIFGDLKSRYESLQSRLGALESWTPGAGVTNVENQGRQVTVVCEGKKVDFSAGGGVTGITAIMCTTDPTTTAAGGKYAIAYTKADGTADSCTVETPAGEKGPDGKSLDGTEYYQSGPTKDRIKKAHSTTGVKASANLVNAAISGAAFGATGMSVSMVGAELSVTGTSSAGVGIANSSKVVGSANKGVAMGDSKPDAADIPPPQ